MQAETFLDDLRRSSIPTIVEVWAPWCGPCKSMAPLLAQIESEHIGRVQVWRLNADDEPETARRLGVFSIPTLILYRDGHETLRRVGAQSTDNLQQLFLAAEQGAQPRFQVALTERFFRLTVGFVLAVMGVCADALWLLPVAGLVMFSAVYDRCPIWQAISPWLARWARSLLPASK